MKLILASSNKGKIKEFKTLLPHVEVIPYKEIVGDIEIIEDGKSFKENAIKKAKTIYDSLKKQFPNQINNMMVISDDSGISVEALDFQPNIYSARYAGINATDQQNNQKLIENLHKKNYTTSKAFYTACIALIYKNNTYTTHGWMYGSIIDTPRGTQGFGYDPLFIPEGFEKTLGELESIEKKAISHRTQAVNLILKIINVVL